MEHIILASAIADRKAFAVAQATGQAEHLSDQGRALWSLIDEWYDRDADALSVNPTLLAERAGQAHPRHAEALRNLISGLNGHACPGNFSEIMLEQRRASLRDEMVMALAESKEANFREALLAYDGLEGALNTGPSDVYMGHDPTLLYEAVVEGEGIPLAPESFNEKIRGGLLPGQHALVFGRPEAGKSLFAINCVRAAAAAGYKCGFWENEDPIVATMMRAAQCVGNVTEAEVKAMHPQLRNKLQKGGWYDRIMFKDSPDGTLWEIKKWVEDNELDFLVINQLANLKAQHRDNRVLELGSLATGARAIAKTTGSAVLSVHQAGESGDGKRVLGMGDLEWSNTAIQSAIDVLIGFGVDEILEAKGQRMLSTPKNKRRLPGRTPEPTLIAIDPERHTIG